jgi:tellurite resistance-related uncharacterized protein
MAGEQRTSPFLTVQQLAERWHTTPNAIYTARSRRRGTYPRGFRLAGKVRFLLSEVEAHEEAEQSADDRFNADLNPVNAPVEPRAAGRSSRNAS